MAESITTKEAEKKQSLFKNFLSKKRILDNFVLYGFIFCFFFLKIHFYFCKTLFDLNLNLNVMIIQGFTNNCIKFK